MHDTRTVFRRHVISGDDAESPFPGFYPRKQLFVGHTDQIRPEVFTHNLIRYHFVPRLVTVQRHILALRVQISPQTRLGQHHCYGFTAVHIISTHAYILYFRPYAQCRVGRKRPRRSGPCQRNKAYPSPSFQGADRASGTVPSPSCLSRHGNNRAGSTHANSSPVPAAGE